MFNFFKKQNPTKSSNEIIACISYIVKRNDKGAIIDVELNDYDKESIESLCYLLNVLGSDSFFVETINIIRDSLIKNDKEDLLIHIFTKLNDTIKQKILQSNKQNKPCIQPSDMII